MKRYINFLRKKAAQFRYVKPVNIALERAVVSFTFDDVPESGFENGMEILHRYGFAGTFYIAFRFMDDEASPTRFRESHLRRAREQGHELAGHTHGHLEFYETTYRDGLEDILLNKTRIRDILPGYTFRNFSYPFGHQTVAARRIAYEQYQTGRGNEHGLNRGRTDLNNLKSVRLYEQSRPLQSAFSTIDRAVRERAWLVFYTHDVQDNYTRYGCSPAYFEAVVRYCRDQGVRVLTVEEAVRLIAPKVNDDTGLHSSTLTTRTP